jgi:hypothetical protein
MKRQLITVGLAASAILAFASISATLAAPGSAPLAQAAESEPNDTFDDADTVPVPGYVTGVITRSVSAADTDLFVINTQIGREYRARLSIWTARPLKLQMNLYNGDREYLETSPSSSSYASITWTAYQDTHYIQIEALDPNTTTLQTAHYQLNIDQLAATPTYTPPPAPPPGESEPNNTFDDADPVSVPGYATGVITHSVSASDTDCFVLDTQVGRKYRARLSIWTPGNLKLQMNLYNGDREYLDTSSSSSIYASMTWTAYQDSHYIQIEALDPNTTTLQTANYRLDIDGFTAVPTPSAVPPPGKDDYEPNDSISEAYVLPVSASVSATYANFYPPPDEDWYAFYVKGGRTYRATTSNLANVDTYLEVFDRNGSRVAKDDDGGGGFASKVEWAASYSIDYYYIRVTNLAPTGDPDDTYDLIVYEVSPGTVRVWLPLCFRCSGDTI